MLGEKICKSLEQSSGFFFSAAEEGVGAVLVNEGVLALFVVFKLGGAAISRLVEEDFRFIVIQIVLKMVCAPGGIFFITHGKSVDCCFLCHIFINENKNISLFILYLKKGVYCILNVWQRKN